MTMVVAWRDPLCIVSDDAATSGFGFVRSSVGPKVVRLSDDVAAGTSGMPTFHSEFLDRVRSLLPTEGWANFEAGVHQILSEINGRSTAPGSGMSAVVVGTIGEGFAQTSART